MKDSFHLHSDLDRVTFSRSFVLISRQSVSKSYGLGSSTFY